MIINEIFYSLQGEGLLAGVPSVFIRLAGCPLRCKWCDTKYALDPAAGEDLNIPAIIKNVSRWQCRYAVITGGEPMVNAELPLLASALKKKGKHITIETAGVKFIPDIACDLMSISPKTSNAGQTRLRLRASDFAFATPDKSPRREPLTRVIRQLIRHYPYQLKFIVESRNDLPEIRQAVKSLGKVDPTRIMLMPEAKTRKELIAKSPMVAELCAKAGYVFCSRLQILLYDGERGR